LYIVYIGLLTHEVTYSHKMNDTERSLDLCALEKQIYDKIVSLNNLEKALDKFVLVADCRKGS